MSEIAASKWILVYRYTKNNIPIITLKLIKIYQLHASQSNMRDMATGFDKSSIYKLACRVSAGNLVCLDRFRLGIQALKINPPKSDNDTLTLHPFMNREAQCINPERTCPKLLWSDN